LIFDTQSLQKKIGAKFNDVSLLEQALTHRSIGHSNNERLEFLGDSILGFIIADAVYAKFAKADEGIMSRLRAHLVNQESLAIIATELSLGDDLILGQGEMKSGGKHRHSILSDAVEALVGAMYLDAGLSKTREWVLSLYKLQLANLTLDTASKDPKTQLQELLQARKQTVPQYTVIATTGLDHNQLFKVECMAAGLSEPIQASASTRKKAEQKAASKALEVLLND